jgi:hypothetical protein
MKRKVTKVTFVIQAEVDVASNAYLHGEVSITLLDHINRVNLEKDGITIDCPSVKYPR